MSRKYKFHNPEGVYPMKSRRELSHRVYFVSFAVQGWVDVFTRSKAIIKEIQENPQESRKEWLIQQFKTTEGNRFWRGDNKPIELWSNKVIDEKINYIHQNPVEKGIVFRAEYYLYSSAADYAGEKGLLDVIIV